MIKQLAVFFVALAITEAVYINYPYENNENLYGNVYTGEAVAPIVAIPVASSDYSGLYDNEEHSRDYYTHPQYSFNYGVNDPHTGDVKNHEEVRDGDLVKGSYSVNEPDGTIRVVEYTADDHNGFNAVVKKIGHAVHPAPIPIAHYPSVGPAYYEHGHYYDGHY